MHDKAGTTQPNPTKDDENLEGQAVEAERPDDDPDAETEDAADAAADGAAEEEDPAASAEGAQAGADGESGDVHIGFGEPAPDSEGEGKDAAEESATFREMRALARERTRENAALKQELAALKAGAAPVAEPLGDKPTMENCNYDEAVFEQKLTAWSARKREIEAREQQAKDAVAAETKAWQERLADFDKRKRELKVSDYADAETAVTEALSPMQIAMLVSGADSPAQLVYALGKSPEKLKELAALKDPLKFAFAAAKLETQVKVTPRKSPPPPERRVTGSAPARTSEQALARLEAEADRTGDRSKVVAYKRQLKAKAA